MTDNTTTNEALLPCPFCGSGAHLYDGSPSHIFPHFVLCGSNECSAQTAFAHTEAGAIELWNRRA
jgi:Lar family restriction alleviation protein